MNGKQTWRLFAAWLLTFAMVFGNSSFAALAEEAEIYIVDEAAEGTADEVGSWQEDILEFQWFYLRKFLHIYK